MSHKHYTWSNEQLKGKVNLVVGNDKQLRTDLLLHFHFVRWRKMRQEAKTFVVQCLVPQKSKPDLIPTWPEKQLLVSQLKLSRS